MRLPLFKVYRAFRELDYLPDAECERVVRLARTKRSAWLEGAPWLLAILAILAWPLFWLYLLAEFGLSGLSRFVPVSTEREINFILLAVTTIVVAAVVRFVTRDLLLWHALRAEIDQARCPKCAQSLLGVRIQYLGIDVGVPGKSFVRCPECGANHNLLELGLTPRDLIPYELREMRPDVGQIRYPGFSRASWS
jgi:hypothetical protein